MDGAAMSAAGSSANSDVATGSCSAPQKRPPIWKRQIFPASPALSGDPFELPSNLTPALRRVKSRTKLPAKGIAITSSFSRLPKSSECNSFAIPSLSLRSSPRKKPMTKADEHLDNQVETRVDSEKCGTEEEVCSFADGKAYSQTPSRDNCCTISLPTKKPRLAFMRMSTSDLRPPRKPVMVEPDFHMPSSSTTPSRLSKTLRHSSANLRVNAEQELTTSQNDSAQPTTAVPSSKLSHSRSTMNLRLTPERDMRERRLSGSDNAPLVGIRASPRRKLQSSATVSDLRHAITAPTRRRRVSLSEDQTQPSKPLRKRSTSLSLGVQIDMTTLCNKDKLMEGDKREDSSPLPAMSNCTNVNGDIPLDTAVNSEQVHMPSMVEEGTTNGHITEETSTPSSLARENTCCQEYDHSTSIINYHDLQEGEAESLESQKNDAEACPEEVSKIYSSIENCPPRSTSLLTPSEETPSEAQAALEINNESVFQERIQPVETVNTNVVDSTILHRNIEGSAKDELASELVISGSGDNTACTCSKEAGSSTGSCLAEPDPDGNEETMNEMKVSTPLSTNLPTSATWSNSNSCQRTPRSEPSPDKRVRFQNVSVYYFARTQGISTVPKSGEVSLGMVDRHFTKRQFPLWFGRRPELTLPSDYEDEVSEGEDTGDVFDPEGLERCTAHQLPLFEGKTRIKMLKRSGVQVQKDENVESLESIRRSRILCGCQCDGGKCEPQTCQCSLDGIGCQVDGLDDFGRSHPCSCSYASCMNPCGRIEFDPEHVKNHYRITMMRLNHAEQKGIYDSPQRIRFTSEGEPQSVSHFTPPLPKSTPLNGTSFSDQRSESIDGMDQPPTRKFPVTPVYKKAKQKRGMRIELASNPALLKVKAKLSWQEPLDPVQDQEMVSNSPNQY